MILRRFTRAIVKALGLTAVARKALESVGLQYMPDRAMERLRDYLAPTDPSLLADATTVCFPQAERQPPPSLFYPSTRTSRENLRMKHAFQSLCASMNELGCLVNRCPPEQADLTIDWSGKNIRYRSLKPPLIMEHGWLPRSSYQISEWGANARSHVAKNYRFHALDARREQIVRRHLERMRRLFRLRLDESRVARAARRFEQPFILFPLQLATDFNLRYSHSPFEDLYSDKPAGTVRFAQACVDHVEAARLPLPVLFKQHPRDENDLESLLHFRDCRNRLISNDQKIDTNELLASGRCKLVVGVNSNTLHEALVWEIPVVALGTLLWDESRQDRPLDKDLSAAEGRLGRETALDATRLSYLFHVVANQWNLSDFQNPLMVDELIRARGHCVPGELRGRFGLAPENVDEIDPPAECVRRVG